MSFPNSLTAAPARTAIGSFPVVPTTTAASPPSMMVESIAFVDRRTSPPSREAAERRQFGSSHSGLSEAGRELALAIDQYKLEQHRRYITCDEMLTVLASLGYGRDGSLFDQRLQ